MSASMKSIKQRLHSVESTMQITKAMELVAASKLRKAQERTERSRPYFETLYQTLAEIVSLNTSILSPYTIKREVKTTCWIVIAGDRGLAGGYNSNVLKLLSREIARRKSQPLVVPLGKKALEYCHQQHLPIWSEAYSQAADITVSECFTLTKLLCKAYIAGEFEEIRIVFTNFVSIMYQTPSTLRLLPYYVDKEQHHKDNALHQITIYEPNGPTVYDMIFPECMGGLLYGALCESIASEHASRRSAMDSATKNGKEMAEDLTLLYNRVRQGAITQEITEIVAGAQT